jgi:hypothetical protein
MISLAFLFMKKTWMTDERQPIFYPETRRFVKEKNHGKALSLADGATAPAGHRAPTPFLLKKS